MKLTLTHYSIGKVQSVELNLAWTVIIQNIVCAILFLQEVYKLIVERTVRNKLQSTDRVGYTLKVVTLSMSKIVHWISIPLSASAMMRSMNDTIHDRVTEVHVRVSHIELGTQHHTSFRSLRCIHLLKKSKALFDRTVTVRTGSTRSSRSTLLLSNLLSSLLVDISMTFLDHPDSKLPQLLKVIGSIIYITPLKTKPLNILKNIFYIFIVLLTRIGVIETEIAYSIIFLSNTKVHTDGLSMTYMKIAIWFRWETSLYASTIFTFL